MTKEELTALGLTEEQADQVLKMRGKELTEAQKATKKAESERDNLQEKLDTANNTLKKFEGYSEDDLKSIETLKKDVSSYKDQIKTLEADHKKALLARDQDDWLKGQYDAYGVASPYARRSLSAEIRDEKTGLKWQDGAFMGFDDFMKKAKESDASLYKTKEEKEAEEGDEGAAAAAPYFTSTKGGDGTSGSSGTSAPAVPIIF